jgi:hypothetical protein
MLQADLRGNERRTPEQDKQQWSEPNEHLIPYLAARLRNKTAQASPK